MAQEKNIVNNICKDGFIFEGLFKLLNVTTKTAEKDGKTLTWDDVKFSNGEESITLSAPANSGGSSLKTHEMYRFVINVDIYRKAKIVGIYEISERGK